MFADAIKPDRERARSVLPSSARVDGAIEETRVGSLSFQTSASCAPILLWSAGRSSKKPSSPKRGTRATRAAQPRGALAKDPGRLGTRVTNMTRFGALRYARAIDAALRRPQGALVPRAAFGN